MSFNERVDRVLFELCGEPMTTWGERYWLLCRMERWKRLPLNGALALCEVRERQRNKLLNT